MSWQIEDQGGLPGVRSDGLNTTKNAVIGGTLAVTGASTFTGAVTFTAAPVLTLPATGPVKVPVTASGGATRTLTAAQSGSINLFDAAGGVVYTLPAESPGLYYDFLTTVLQTGGSDEIIIATASVFMAGTIVMGQEAITPAANPGPKFFSGNGTSHVELDMNATTTGGGIGSWIRVICISATLWYATGLILSPSGNVASPFST